MGCDGTKDRSATIYDHEDASHQVRLFLEKSVACKLMFRASAIEAVYDSETFHTFRQEGTIYIKLASSKKAPLPFREYDGAFHSRCAVLSAIDDQARLYASKLNPIYSGAPSVAAKYLLEGMRKRVSAPYVKRRPNGYEATMQDPVYNALVRYELMEGARVKRNGEIITRGATTTRLGFMVLKVLAEKNEKFKSYFDVYVPKKVEDKAVTRWVTEIIME